MRSASRSSRCLIGLATTLLLIGCENSSAPVANARNFTASAGGADFAPAPMMSPMAPASMERAKSEAPQALMAQPAMAGRKIIFDANVTLVTEDLNKLEATLIRLVEAQKAYVADSDRTGAAGATRQGTWKVRVPVEAYDVFLKAAVGLGELVSVRANSQDVSEEFFDLEARETAKKVEETRLLKHLSESTGKLEEILAVERELSRVRSEIERMQGRLRVLANLTSLATITITASEVKDYVPPQAPTLTTRISRTFQGSLDSLSHFGETLLMAGVAITPWLPIIIIAAVVLWLVVRRIVREIRRALARPAVTS